MLRVLSLACVAVVSLVSMTALAADGEGYRSRLFNGTDLDGWQVTGCQVAVENGLLVLTAGDGLVRTNERHGDFILEVDWRPRRGTNYDSGIYIRADLPEEGKPWPARYQINLKQGGEGNLLGIDGAKFDRPGQARRVEPFQDHRGRRYRRTGDQRQAGLESRRLEERRRLHRAAIGS